MKVLKVGIAILVTVLAAGCASGPAFNDMKGSFAPMMADQGRIYFYRTAMGGVAVQPSIYLNGQVVGKAVPGGFFYADRPSGNYEVSATTEAENKLTFTLERAQTRYVRLDMNIGLFVGHIVPRLIDENDGAKEIQTTKFAGEAPPKP
jgi:Mn2+/Fe2+ NRAMP family transporter